MRKKLFLMLILFQGLSVAAQSISDAVLLMKEGRYAEAESALKSCEGSEGLHAEWYLTLAAVYEKQGLFLQAVDILKQGFYRLGNQKEISFNLGNNLYALGRWKEAGDYYTQAISADASFYQAYLNRGNSFLKQNQYAHAVDDYEMVLKLSPDHPQKSHLEKIVFLLKEEQKAEAERQIREEEMRIAKERRMEELRSQAAGELSDLDQSKNLQVDNTGMEDYMLNLDIME